MKRCSTFPPQSLSSKFSRWVHLLTSVCLLLMRRYRPRIHPMSSSGAPPRPVELARSDPLLLRLIATAWDQGESNCFSFVP